jgi:hypothetical protein
MMEVAFAQGADAYVLTETRSRFNESTLAAALAALGERGSEGVLAVDADLDPAMDAVSPAFLVITRDAVVRLGPLDERLDARCGLIDLYMRAEMREIPVVRVKGLPLSFDTNRAEMLAAWRLGHRALDAAWTLAGKWGCEPLLEKLRTAFADRDIPPPPPVANEHSGRDAMLVEWWERRTANGVVGTLTQIDPVPDQEAVLPPAILDASVAVPFAALPGSMANQRVAAIIQLHNHEVSWQTFEALKHIPGRCDLFITTDTDAKRGSIAALFDGWTAGTIDVRVLPNHGGCVWPMLEVLREIVDQYDLLLHLHGEPSISRDRGTDWRTWHYETLCGSRDIVTSVFAAFAAKPRLGIVFPQQCGTTRTAISWGNCFEAAQDLASRIGIDLQVDQPLEFPTGFMFWARTAALAPLLAFDLTPADFVEGFGGPTFSHAIERLLLQTGEHSGHTWIKIARTDLGDVMPPPLTVESPGQLGEQLTSISYLLTDPVLWEVGRAKSPWRFRPDDTDLPRLTLIAAANWSRERWARCAAVTRAQFPQLEIRVMTVPPCADKAGVPSPVDVRAQEIFVATDEACAQIALQLVQLQHRFFSRSERVQMLEELTQDQPLLTRLRAGVATHDDDLTTWPQERRA